MTYTTNRITHKILKKDVKKISRDTILYRVIFLYILACNLRLKRLSPLHTLSLTSTIAPRSHVETKSNKHSTTNTPPPPNSRYANKSVN